MINSYYTRFINSLKLKKNYLTFVKTINLH